MTITKLEHNISENNSVKKKNIHIKRKSPTVNFEKTIYSFESFDAFCDFCTFIGNTMEGKEIYHISKTSDLYEYNSNFYLILSNINVTSPYLKYFCSSITEFAHFVNSSELFERKIKEYGKCIIEESALNTCLKHFSKK